VKETCLKPVENFPEETACNSHKPNNKVSGAILVDAMSQFSMHLQVADSMSAIWTALLDDPRAALDTHFDALAK
jgi:hypothetical protein